MAKSLWKSRPAVALQSEAVDPDGSTVLGLGRPLLFVSHSLCVRNSIEERFCVRGRSDLTGKKLLAGLILTIERLG